MSDTKKILTSKAISDTLLAVARGSNYLMLVVEERQVDPDTAHNALQRLHATGLLRRHRKAGRIVRYSVNGDKLRELFLQFITDEISKLAFIPKHGPSENSKLLQEAGARARALLEEIRAGRPEQQIELLTTYLAVQPAGRTLREYLLAFTKEATVHQERIGKGPETQALKDQKVMAGQLEHLGVELEEMEKQHVLARLAEGLRGLKTR